MKINKLIFSNINSLKGTYSIDFDNEELSQDNIFSIIGETGSGKSSILDAITLALFNETTRIGKITGSSNEIMNRDSGDCSSEVFFNIGDKHYSSLFTQKRARNKKDGNFQPYKKILKDLDNNKVIAQNKNYDEKLNEILNLSFEQFCKSVILPQGDFNKFLIADDSKKATILEKITGTEIYTILSKKIYEHTKQEEEKKNTLSLQLGEQKLLTAEERKAISEEIDTINKEIETGKTQLDKYTKILNWYRDYRKTEEDEKQLENIKQTLSEKAERYIINQNKINTHEKAKEPKQLQDTITITKDELTKIKIETDNLKNKISELELEKKEFEVKSNQEQIKLNDLIENQKNLTQTVKKVRELDSNISSKINNVENIEREKNKTENSIKTKNSNINRLSSEIDKLQSQNIVHKSFIDNNCIDKKLVDNFTKIISNNQKLKTTLSKLKENTIKLKDLENSIILNNTELNKQSPLLLESNNSLETYKNNKSLSFNTTELNDKISSLEKERESLSNLVSKAHSLNLLKKQIKTQEIELQQSNERVEKTNEKLSTAKDLYSSYSVSLERLKELLELKAFVKDIKDNEPCPLCGSVNHPSPLKVESNQVDNEQEKLKAAKAQYEQLNNLFIKEKTENDLIKSNLNNNKNEVENTQSLLEIKLKTKTDDFESYIETKREKLSTEIKNLRDNIDSYYQIKSLYDKELANNKSLMTKIESINEKIESSNADKENINKENEDLNLEISIIEKFFKDYQEFKTLQIHELENRKNAFEKHDNDYKSNLKDIKNKNEQIQSIKDELTQEKTELTNLSNSFAESNKILQLLKNERFELFADKNCDDEIEKLESKINESRVFVEKISYSLQKIESTIISINSTISEKAKQFGSKNTILNKLNIDLVKALEQNDFINIEEAIASILPKEIFDSLKEQIEKYEKLKTKSEILSSELKEERKTLNNTKPDEAENEIKNLYVDLDTNLAQLNRDYGTKTQILVSDDKVKERFSSLQKQLEKQTLIFNNWKNLNNLVGSADGNKFRKLAQGITLDYLLYNTNNKLSKLTDRYVLSRNTDENNFTNSLDIYVTDLYMNGIKRSCRTLSGGETFLVSLSLALGLSELVNAKNPSQTLFLDEGFGTLDEETLETAINTLIQLSEKENKLIGIISHVQRIKEAFPSQILVSKKGNGHSIIQGPGVSII